MTATTSTAIAVAEPLFTGQEELALAGFYNTHRPHRTLRQAAPLRPLPDGITDLGHFRVQRRDRAGGVIHEYHLVA